MDAGPCGTLGKLKTPVASAVAVIFCPVARFVSVAAEAGIGAPVWSMTLPETVLAWSGA